MRCYLHQLLTVRWECSFGPSFAARDRAGPVLVSGQAAASVRRTTHCYPATVMLGANLATLTQPGPPGTSPGNPLWSPAHVRSCPMSCARQSSMCWTVNFTPTCCSDLLACMQGPGCGGRGHCRRRVQRPAAARGLPGGAVLEHRCHRWKQTQFSGWAVPDRGWYALIAPATGACAARSTVGGHRQRRCRGDWQAGQQHRCTRGWCPTAAA